MRWLDGITDSIDMNFSQLQEIAEEREVTVTVTLNPLDMGKVIGRQGKIAKALRTLVRAGSQKENKKYNIEIQERGEKL